ncbi:zinc finger BED domain-containing protein 4-like isoform X1 [Drosophila willistoni]|uniref:zinc finger BED domain-containing protein 4-like isoform X1 n=1 Tax=Drosophila willistoni TaxID=7260 RepID=UPI001F07BF00|nr:zinc finger BED domain-containing protein 4-like isoform X1 [Drosophila willistoni]
MKAASRYFLGNGKHIPCFAHTIHLVVDDSVKEIASFCSILDKVKKIVMHFKHSPALMDELQKAQADEGIPEGCIKTLQQSVDTRWNSCLEMLVSFLSLANKVAIILIKRSEKVKGLPEMLSTDELSTCKDFCSLLNPFKDATEKISGEKYVTVSMVIPLISLLLKKMQIAKVESADGILAQDSLHKQLEKRCKPLELNKVLVKSSFLDPRFKKMYISPIGVQEATKDILQELITFTEEKLISDDENSDDQGDSLEKAHNRSIVKVDGSENRELKMYLSLPQTSWESNPIMFWSSYKAAMPGLSKLALRYLTTPGSSVPSERLASAIKCVVCDSRSRMTDTHKTERVFLKSLNSKYWS